MTKYVFPELPKSALLLKRRRYAVYKCVPENKRYAFEDADVFIWDGLYDAVVSFAKYRDGKIYEAQLAFTPVEHELEDSVTIEDFFEKSKQSQLKFFKEAGS